MSVIKFKNKSGFTQIDNDLFYVQSVVSASAFSLLIRIYRATLGYGVAVKALSGVYLQKTANLSKNTVTKAIKELEDAGVLLVKRRARLSSYYQISVNGVVKLCSEVKASLEEMMDLNLELEGLEEEPIEEEVVAVKEEAPKISDNGFDIFWNIYDKKVTRTECKAQWDKLKSSDHKNIMSTVEEYVKSTPEKQYRKDPINYLSKRVWEDEIISRSDVEAQPNNVIKFSSTPSIAREVVEAGTIADIEINNFLQSRGSKGKSCSV